MKFLQLNMKKNSKLLALSLDEAEFAQMVKAVRDAEALLGETSYELSEKSIKNRNFARSLYASADIKKGEIFSENNVKSVRPGFGLEPKFMPRLLGKTAKRDIEFGERITKKDL